VSEPGKITLAGITHEVVGAKIPPEPPVRTVIVDANGLLYQRVEWHTFDIIPWSRVAWASVGERRGQHRPTWPELLQRGPVTILWTPPSPTPSPEER
jgi:hypothetical protein